MGIIRSKTLLFMTLNVINCLFVALRPTREFFTHEETSTASKFDYTRHLLPLSSGGLFSMPYVVLYNGHLWGPMTLERLAVELSLHVHVLITYVCRDRGSISRLRGESSTIIFGPSSYKVRTTKYYIRKGPVVPIIKGPP